MTTLEKRYYKYFVLGGIVSKDDFQKMQELKHKIPTDEFIKMCNEMRERRKN